jgi:hypothetical protein
LTIEEKGGYSSITVALRADQALCALARHVYHR